MWNFPSIWSWNWKRKTWNDYTATWTYFFLHLSWLYLCMRWWLIFSQHIITLNLQEISAPKQISVCADFVYVFFPLFFSLSCDFDGRTSMSLFLLLCKWRPGLFIHLFWYSVCECFNRNISFTHLAQIQFTRVKWILAWSKRK